ncbi:MAG: NAD-dependent epimerase/dehydratase family protein [Bacteroidia bacterium]|nr:NAD-dependent epimerase/dehydratase family protein [Bacteroidia bacterium]
MKILVTGGAGFIGGNLIERLISEKHEVISIDNYSTGHTANHVRGAKYINTDLEKIEHLKYSGIRLCFHLGAQSRVQPSFDDPKESMRVNVNGTEKIMEWARNNKVRVIYAGSSSKHQDPTASPYAMYKYLGEEVCKLYRNSFNVDVRIARFYNVYGRGELLDETYGSLLGIWRAKLSKSEALPIVGNGSQRRDFIHVDDIVDGLIKISRTKDIHEDAWELGTGINYSVNEIYSMFDKNFSVKSIHIPEQPGNYKETLNTNTDAIYRLGWKPQDRLYNYIKSLSK